MVELLPSMCKTFGSIPSPSKNKNENKGEKRKLVLIKDSTSESFVILGVLGVNRSA